MGPQPTVASRPLLLGLRTMPQALSLLLVFVYTKIGLDQKPGTISYVSAGTGVHLLVTVLSLPELTALCCHVILTPPGEGSKSPRPPWGPATGITASCVL